jgi:hypothetical protein
MCRRNYLSLEYLIGRTMQNTLLSMDLEGNYRQVRCMCVGVSCTFRCRC